MDFVVLLLLFKQLLFADEFLDEVVVLGLEDAGVVFENERRFCLQHQFLFLPQTVLQFIH